MSRNRRKKSYSILFRIGRKGAILLLAVGLPVLIFLLTFHINKVEVAGINRYTEEQIKTLVMKTKPDSNALYLYLKYRFFEKPRLPFVEKIEVEMADNHSVTIYVYEKMVAGCVEFMGEYLYFDKDGIVVESSTQRLDRVPVIKGLEFNEIILNEKLSVQKDELFNVIINLTQLIERYGLDIDTVSFGTDYEVTATQEGITVLLGKKDTYDEQFSDLKSILAEAEGMDIIIDMRKYSKDSRKFIAKPKKSTE